MTVIVKDHVADLAPLAAARVAAGRVGVATPGAVRHRDRSDEELSQLGSAGIEELFRRHNGALSRFCLGITGHPDDAAEAMQTAWERALVTFSKRRGAVLKVRPWLYTVARNECLDRMRARGAVQMVDIHDIELAGGLTPEETSEQRAELEVLLHDLAALSERQRSALILREFAGFEAEELASELGTSSSRALGLVAEARRSLIERRSGRVLPCSTAQRELTRMRRRSTCVQAHLDSCGDCRYFEHRRRGRSLSSLAITPLLFVRGLAERLLAIGSAGPDFAKVAIATAAVAGSIGVAAAPSDRDARPFKAGPRAAAVEPAPPSRQRSRPAPSAMAKTATARDHSASRSTATRGARTRANSPARRRPDAIRPAPAPPTATATAPAAAASPAPAEASRAVTATVDALVEEVSTTTRSTVEEGLTAAETLSTAVKTTSATAAARLAPPLGLSR